MLHRGRRLRAEARPPLFRGRADPSGHIEASEQGRCVADRAGDHANTGAAAPGLKAGRPKRGGAREGGQDRNPCHARFGQDRHAPLPLPVGRSSADHDRSPCADIDLDQTRENSKGPENDPASAPGLAAELSKRLAVRHADSRHLQSHYRADRKTDVHFCTTPLSVRPGTGATAPARL
jgi:hypothetical protein